MAEAVSKQVLRYWLACVRMEEALGSRPRARRTPTRQGPVQVEMGQPVEGAEYLRVPCDEAMWRVAAQQGTLRLDFDAAAAAFFETWLGRQYRTFAMAEPGKRRDRGSKGNKGSKGDQDAEERVKHLLAFPVVHLPRGELAGLLRCDVQAEFLQADGTPFPVPDQKTRRAGAWPPPPVELRVAGPDRPSEGRLPFFVDTRLLHDQLGVEPQEIDGLFEKLQPADDGEVSPESMLHTLCELLAAPGEEAGAGTDTPGEEAGAGTDTPGEEAGAGTDTPQGTKPDMGALLSLLVSRMNARLSMRPRGAKAYSQAIVLDAQQARSTWHLQRELQMLIHERPSGSEEAGTSRAALDGYLSGTRPAPGLALQRAAFPGSTLTPSQRNAAEHALGSRLCAVQGPPGTGKTTLILHLAAQHIVEQVDALVDGGTMGTRLMLVASTNNRAVDNVIEPLNLEPALAGDGLPLALRTGSREVCDRVSTRPLRAAASWLSPYLHRGDDDVAEHTRALEAAIGHYRQLRAQLLEGEAPRLQALERATLEGEIGAAVQAVDRQLARTRLSKRTRELPEVTLAELELLQQTTAAVDALVELAAMEASKTALARLEKRYEKFQRTLGEQAQALHARLSGGAPWPLPPAGADRKGTPAEQMEAWEEALDRSFVALEKLARQIARSRQRRALLKQREVLLAELKAQREQPELKAQREQPELKAQREQPELKAQREQPELLDPLRQELFSAALRVRKAWAIVHAAKLHDALQIAAKYTGSERSMRTLFRAEDEAGRWVRGLCGVWGCTLLSIANAVPAESRALHRLVIDEAGQCHPAHAVSALMRCGSALIIGDVHQLQPVVGLGAQEEGRVQAQARLKLDAATLAPYRVFSGGEASVQSLADRAVGGPLRLIDHFRCQPPIIALCDALCDYGLNVQTPPRSRSAHTPLLHAPLLFVQVRGEQERLGGSWVNHAQLDVCMELLEEILQSGIGSGEIAIITPYRGQLELLQRAAARRGIPVDRGLEADDQLDLFGSTGSSGRSGGAGLGGLTLGTVHRFQGGERSVVIFSSVLTRQGSLGFLNNRVNLLNVTISRAREHLVTVGDAATLGAGRYTRQLLRGAAPTWQQGVDPDPGGRDAE